ncbi:MAG: RNB domain-containing ribonuclease [Candidatus Omnitrophota bacterium]|nr:RNB domain-containing ribonuclease [Candidatus Omnitrophota bacterium]MDZ4241902.1 RNB domain-containing ribonuclease [Candidatus Omnitrophota bacterium]
MRPHRSVDLYAAAHETMSKYGFLWKFPSGVHREAKNLVDTVASAREPGIQDLRKLLWSSIDNEDSLDLDQLAFCESLPHDEIRVRVAIADVDHYVRRNSEVDRHAAKNGVSVYAAVQTFPMLPERLSTDLTSLNPGQDRLAVVMDFAVDRNGGVHGGKVYRALVHNHAKLVYETVGDWLEGKGPLPESIVRIPALAAQVRLQDRASQRLQELRKAKGAMEFETIEVVPVIKNGKVLGLKERHDNRAHHLIENFMVAANGVMATFIKQHGYPLIQRVVREPERWPKIREVALALGVKLPRDPDPKALADFLERERQIHPAQFPDLSLTVIKLIGKAEYDFTYPQEKSEGHFGLAVEDYAHSTAPNRRYVDLIVQRILKCVLLKKPLPYTKTELKDIASWCTDRDQAAKKVERFIHKIASAVLLEPRVGEVFEAIVTGATEKGTFVRLLDPPAEGMVVRRFDGMDVGDKVRVKLVKVSPQRGFVDFEGIALYRQELLAPEKKPAAVARAPRRRKGFFRRRRR